MQKHYLKLSEEKFDCDQHKPEIVTEYKGDFNWQKLYVKMDVEESIRLINYAQDF